MLAKCFFFLTQHQSYGILNCAILYIGFCWFFFNRLGTYLILDFAIARGPSQSQGSGWNEISICKYLFRATSGVAFSVSTLHQVPKSWPRYPLQFSRIIYIFQNYRMKWPSFEENRISGSHVSWAPVSLSLRYMFYSISSVPYFITTMYMKNCSCIIPLLFHLLFRSVVVSYCDGCACG